MKKLKKRANRETISPQIQEMHYERDQIMSAENQTNIKMGSEAMPPAH